MFEQSHDKLNFQTVQPNTISTIFYAMSTKVQEQTTYLVDF